MGWRDCAGLAAVALGVSAIAARVPASASDFAVGDVFVGGKDGKYQRYSSSGILIEVLDNGDSQQASGCAVDGALDLYTTAFADNRLGEVRADPHPVLLDISTSGIAGAPDRQNESVSVSSSGDVYVGHAGGTGNSQVHRYDAAGVLAGEYSVSVEDSGSDWIDFAADQCTLFYTSEGVTIRRFDTCTSTQLPDFATLPVSGPTLAGALRILPPGDGCGGLLVATYADVKRLDAAGAVIASYDAPGEDSWFAMNLTPDGQSFWSAGEATNNVYRFNIATGAVEVGPSKESGGGETVYG